MFDADGHAASQAELAVLYASGRGVPQDIGQAAVWAAEAANQGDAQGQLFLGGLYRDGLGVARDADMAFSWTVLAANQNLGLAHLRLAKLEPSSRTERRRIARQDLRRYLELAPPSGRFRVQIRRMLDALE